MRVEISTGIEYSTINRLYLQMRMEITTGQILCADEKLGGGLEGKLKSHYERTGMVLAAASPYAAAAHAAVAHAATCQGG
jgi:hypothetical protein